MTDSVKSAHEAAERFDTGTRERPLPMNAARQSAFVSGAEWQRSRDESEAMKVAAQRAVRIRELEAELRELEAASTVEWATDQVEPGRPVYPGVRHRRSQFAAEMAVSNPESKARRVLKRVAIHGPWEEVTDDE